MCVTRCVFAHQWKLLVYVLQHLPLPEHQLVLSPGLSLLQLGREEGRAGREEDSGRKGGKEWVEYLSVSWEKGM